jgi:hypothetical protein
MYIYTKLFCNIPCTLIFISVNPPGFMVIECVCGVLPCSKLLYEIVHIHAKCGFPNLDHIIVLDILLDPDSLAVRVMSHLCTVWVDRLVCLVLA